MFVFRYTTYLFADIILKTTDPGASDVVIVVQPESYFLKMYNSSGQYTLQLCGLYRANLVHLKKLGYIVVTVSTIVYYKQPIEIIISQPRVKLYLLFAIHFSNHIFAK